MQLTTQDLWEQRLDEPDICYRMFQAWIKQTPRGMPNDPGLAQAFDWTSRAIAYDQSTDIPSDPKARVSYMFERSTRLACIGINKLLRAELDSPELQIDPRLLVRLAQVSVALPAASLGLQAVGGDWEIPETASDEQVQNLIKMLSGVVKT